jgi:hypothetical protein
MTFELLKVCRQANPAWIELRVMYVRSTVTDRHARWVIINPFNPHELLIGFVCFCGLSLLNAPWRTVPLLLPLFGSVPTDLLTHTQTQIKI